MGSTGYYSPDFSTRPATIDEKPAERNGKKRRFLRIPCKSIFACIRAESEHIVVEVVNISRAGVGFRSFRHFRAGAEVSIATHYIEGGQNIFQTGRIVRSHLPSGTTCVEYGVEFGVN
jgi:hypothetical protein